MPRLCCHSWCKISTFLCLLAFVAIDSHPPSEDGVVCTQGRPKGRKKVQRYRCRSSSAQRKYLFFLKKRWSCLASVKTLLLCVKTDFALIPAHHICFFFTCRFFDNVLYYFGKLGCMSGHPTSSTVFFSFSSFSHGTITIFVEK